MGQSDTSTDIATYIDCIGLGADAVKINTEHHHIVTVHYQAVVLPIY